MDELDTVRHYLGALGREDHEAASELLDPAVVVVAPSGAETRGLDQVRAGWGQPGYDHLVRSREWLAVEEQDGEVWAAARDTYRWQDSGEVAHVRRWNARFTFRAGRIARIEASVESEAA